MLLKASAKAPAHAATADFDVFCSNLVGSFGRMMSARSSPVRNRSISRMNRRLGRAA